MDIKFRTRHLVSAIEKIQEDLEVFSEEIWKNIDHNDAEKLEAGVKLKQAYNEKRKAFNVAAQSLSSLLQSHAKGNSSAESVKAEAESASDIPIEKSTETEPKPKTERSKEQELNEDFKITVPFGFTLEDKTFTGLSNWSVFYETFLREMAKRDQQKFSELPDRDAFRTEEGKTMFAKSADVLRDPLPILENVFAEVDLPLELIIQNIKNLVREFNVSTDSMKILLKEKKRGTVMAKSIAA